MFAKVLICHFAAYRVDQSPEETLIAKLLSIGALMVMRMSIRTVGLLGHRRKVEKLIIHFC